MPANVSKFPPRLGNFTHVSERRYVMDVPSLGVTFDLGRLRRERSELVGELIVHCTIAGARTIEGTLSAADFNVSSQQARITRAKFLADRARTKADDLDWIGLVEEFCQRVVKFDQQGSAERKFKDAEEPAAGAELMMAGLPLLARHPIIWFGDGGSGKSLLALYIGAQLAMNGHRVLYADWEFAIEDHRERLGKLCAPNPVPDEFWHVRCTTPLCQDIERLAAMIARNQITYLVCDSVAFACAGAPESAEAATDYFRALRALNVGSLNVAHVSRGGEETGADLKPFGSNFWHQGARATWFVKRADEENQADVLEMALIQRKANIGQRWNQAQGVRFEFLPARTTVTRFDVLDHSELSVKLPLNQRMRGELRTGPLSTHNLAEKLNCKESSIRGVMTRSRQFVRLQDGRIALSAGPREDEDGVPF